MSLKKILEMIDKVYRKTIRVNFYRRLPPINLKKNFLGTIGFTTVFFKQKQSYVGQSNVLYCSVQS